MPVFNEFEEHGHEVRPLLPKGEALLALTIAEPAFGSTGKHDPKFPSSKRGRRFTRRARTAADAVDRASGKARLPRGIAWLVMGIAALFSWSPSWAGPGKLFRRWLGGRVVDGEAGRIARAMQAELTPYGDCGYLAVTDLSVHLLKPAPILTKRAIATDPPQWTINREAITSARRVPRLFARARIELTFTDGSRIVLSQGPFHPGGWHAAQVVAALSG